KDWIPENPSGETTVTLTLQYLDKNNTWTTLSEVLLDGTADTEPHGPAYEDTPWHAVWEDLPAYHPDGYNQTAGGDSAPTEYRVTEQIHNGDGYLLLEDSLDGN